MTKLNQIIAVEKGVKNKAHKVLTEAHHNLHRAPQVSGISRTYQPKDEDGQQLPPEYTKVQVYALAEVKRVEEALSRLFDVVAMKDWTNCSARADVTVDGRVILGDVPVSYLLFLEKQLVDLGTFMGNLPVLDPAESWTYNQNAAVYCTDPAKTLRTRKVPRNHVKAEATDRHPAQVEVYYEDVVVGTWSAVKFSGAIPLSVRDDLAGRVVRLLEAVKAAREAANGTDVVADVLAGAAVFGYLLGGLTPAS